ncbi:MAG TPA: pirin family protein, partial [Aeromicrobium sp.]|nr:pirin family protein [Aeromicrobium sp.]
LGFGPVIALNEEQVPAGGGYASHFHADVEIVTWVLEGALAHQDTTGARGVVEPGNLQWLTAGDGVQHAEHNASSTEPLRFLQLMLRSDHAGEPIYANHLAAGPTTCVVADHTPATVVVTTASTQIDGPALVHATHGTITVAGVELEPGDEARLPARGPYDVTAPGQSGALIVQVR